MTGAVLRAALKASDLSLNAGVLHSAGRLWEVVIGFLRRALLGDVAEGEGLGAGSVAGGERGQGRDGAALQPVVLHLGQRADRGGGPGRAAELGPGALLVGAAELRVGHRGHAVAQRGRVELAGVGAAPLQQLAVRVLVRLVDFGPARLARFAPLPRGGGRGGRGARGGGVLGPLGATRGAGSAPAPPPAAAVVRAAATAAVTQFPRLRLDVHLHIHAAPISAYRNAHNHKHEG